jgi:RNA recognition motif-containing protein
MNIFVGNLSFETTDEELRESFSAFGELTSVTILKDKFTNRSRGFGFVEMPNTEEANAAIEALNGKSVNGRTINVAEARPREEKPMGSRPRSGGGMSSNRSRSW